MTKDDSLEDGQVGGYFVIGVIGLILGYLVGIGLPRIILPDAVYAATYADFYRSEPGGPRAISLYYLFRNSIIGIGFIGGIVGTYILKKTNISTGSQVSLSLILKYAVIACLGGFLFFIISAVISSFIFDIPSAYNPYELDAVHQSRVFRAQATVVGVIVSLAGSITVGYQRRLQTYKQHQRSRFESIKEEYDSVLNEIGINESNQPNFFAEYNPDNQESIQDRDQALESLNRIVERYGSLVQRSNRLVEMYSDLSHTDDLDYVQGLIGRVHRKIKTGDTEELQELNNNVQSCIQTVSRAERRDEVLKKIRQENYPDDITAKLREDVLAADISEEDSGEILEFIERFLNIIDKTKRLDESTSGIDTDNIWDELRISLDEKNLDSLNRVEQFIDDIIQILTFCDQNNPEYTDIQNSKLLNTVNRAIRENDPSLLEKHIEQIEKLDEAWTLEHLNELNWRQFEYLVAQLWSDSGYNTAVTSGSGDEGIDVAAENGSERIAIQAKRNSRGNKVGNRVIRNTAGVLPRGFDRVIVVTSSSFTKPAKKEAQKYGGQVSLVNGRSLLQELNESNLTPEAFK